MRRVRRTKAQKQLQYTKWMTNKNYETLSEHKNDYQRTKNK